MTIPTADSSPPPSNRKRYTRKQIIVSNIIFWGLVAVLAWACTTIDFEVPEEPERPIDVTLDTQENPFAIEEKLTPEQASGNADVLVSYGAITHLIGETRGPISRIPGRVIGWRDRQVEVQYPGQGGDEYIKVWVDYGEGFDPADLHDNKSNLALCRFGKIGDWPTFSECSQEN